MSSENRDRPRNPSASSPRSPELDRRLFLGGSAGLLSGAAFGGLFGAPALADPPAEPLETSPRLAQAFEVRSEAADRHRQRPAADQTPNGDEQALPDYLACFSKGLPHDDLGRVDPKAYEVLLAALASGRPEDFELVPLGGYSKLANPQAALGYELIGPDPAQLALPPAPRFASAAQAAEMVELYWRALLRDVPFERYGDHPGVRSAARELAALEGFTGPTRPQDLFRAGTPGALAGPHISQFLWTPIPYLPVWVEQAVRTAAPEIDYMTRYERHLGIQRGDLAGPTRFDGESRYLRNGRDLGEYVHRDFPYQAYLGACLYLLQINAPLDGGNPYKHSRTQGPFTTFGSPYALYLLAMVSHLSLKTAWYQKWHVHRRLRPEALGGRLDRHLAGLADFPLHPSLMTSEAVAETRERTGSALLPQAYPEGSPLHPSYPAAHAVTAGAAVTVLKALFDESYPLPDPVVATPDGRELRPYDGPSLTVGGELDKLAANVALGRDFAGVHYRSDSEAGMALGEELALAVLAEVRHTGNELFQGWSVRCFDGRRRQV